MTKIVPDMDVRSSPNLENPDIPRTRKILKRPHVLDKLAQIRNARLMLVSAPPGYGKTASVADFVLESDMRCAWHTIYESERDLYSLVSHSIYALETVVPGIKDCTLTPQNTPRGYAAEIAGFVRKHSPSHEHVIYVLDDVQLVFGALNTEAYVQALIELLPSNYHVIIISRVLPTLPIAELIARGEVQAIGQQDLRFGQEDAAALIDLYQSPIRKFTLSKRIEAMDGWPAGVMLSLQPLSPEIEHEILEGKSGPEAIFAELAKSLLSRQTPVLLEFLMVSSIFEKVAPELCEQVLKISDSRNNLRYILEQNLFAARVHGGVVYHRLFRDFLQQELKHWSPERFRELHNNAGDWFYQKGDFEKAFDHYMEGGFIDESVDIVERMQWEYFNLGKIETLLNWRRHLNTEARKTPSLILTCAIIHTDRSEFEEARYELDTAQSIFSEAQNTIKLAEVVVQRGVIDLREGAFSSVIDAMLDVELDRRLPNRLRAQAKHLSAQAFLAQGMLDQGIAALEEIVPVYEEHHSILALSAVLQDLEQAYQQVGKDVQASYCLQRVVALRRQLGRPDTLALALNNLGYYYHQTGDFKNAMSAFEEGLQIVANTVNRRIESFLNWSVADLQRDIGNFEDAHVTYRRAYELSQRAEQSLKSSIVLNMSVFYRWTGDYVRAGQCASDVMHSGIFHQDSAEYILAQTTLLVTHAMHTEDRNVTAEMDKVLKRFPRGHLNILAQVYAMMADVALRYKDMDRVTRYLDELLHILNEYSKLITMANEIIASENLRKFVFSQLRYGRLAKYISNLERHRYRSQAPRLLINPPGTQDLPYNIRVYTLGAERIEVDGRVIDPSAWRAAKAKEFFLYLLFHRTGHRRDISLEFWPDSSSERVRSNFHTTLYRARQALGEDIIVYDGSVYRLHDDVQVWCDAQEFVELVRQARLLEKSGAAAEDLWRRALSIYKGEFLSDLDADWMTVQRTLIMESYIEALNGVGDSALSQQNFREAEQILKQALSVDPYREETYRALMRCYGERGEHHLLLRIYKRLSSLYRDEFGIVPSQETMSVLQKYMAVSPQTK